MIARCWPGEGRKNDAVKPMKPIPHMHMYGRGAGSAAILGDARAAVQAIVLVKRLTEPTLLGGTRISRINYHTLNQPPAHVTSRKFAM